jgi:hypothetical protein
MPTSESTISPNPTNASYTPSSHRANASNVTLDIRTYVLYNYHAPVARFSRCHIRSIQPVHRIRSRVLNTVNRQPVSTQESYPLPHTLQTFYYALRSNALPRVHAACLASCCRIIAQSDPPEPLKTFDPTGSERWFSNAVTDLVTSGRQG